jgi:PAS domain S-box-containing protein
MGKPLRVLIIEDSEDDARLILRELGSSGYDPISKRVEKREAMGSALKEETWDIVISDYTMPHFSAPAALKLLQESGLDLPFIIVTGTVGEEIVVEAMKAGAHDYVMKGNLKRLVSAIERELSDAEIRRGRRKAEDALKVSEIKYRTLFESQPIGITISDKAGNIKESNAEAERLLGLPKAFQIQRQIDGHEWQIVRPDGSPMPADEYASVRALKENRTIENVEMGIVKGEGVITWINVTAAPLPLREYGVIITYRDITGRKQADQALKESEKRYRALFESAAEGIIITDAETRKHKYANPAICKMLGYSQEELTNLGVSDIHPKGSLEVVIAAFNSHAKGQETFASLPCLKKNGTIIYADINAASSIIDGRECNIGFFSDVTERKNLQIQLMAQDRLAAIGQLVSGVAHEINNPLTAVIGFSELLMKRTDLPEAAREDLKVVNDEAQRTAKIVQNLLTFARKQPEGKTKIQVNEQIERVIVLRAHEQKINNIRLITHFAADLPKIMGNSSQLQQVFFNVVINAEFFMVQTHQKGTLTITTERIRDFVRASIADDGPGISEDNMKQLFTPFFTNKDVGKGTGLGLAISYGIISEHGGRMWADSKFGKGATFIVELPIYKAAANEQADGPS